MTARPHYLPALLDRKFGAHRGRNSRACKSIGVQSSNLSSALGGTSTLSQKHIDALNALPDFAPPSGITQELYEDGAVQQLITWFTARLSPQAASDLEFIARFHTLPSHHMPDLTASEDATARLMEIILGQYKFHCREAYPSQYDDTSRAIAAEKEEARKQLNFELNERKHLVADELTENALNDDEDPLA